MSVMNFCPACGNTLGATGKFCDGCGYKLDSIDVPPPPTEALSDAQFDDRFTSCMIGNGYSVPLGALPKLRALLPYFEEKAKDVGTIAGTKSVWNYLAGQVTSFGVGALLLETPPGWAEALSALGQEASANVPFEHAVLDCAIRAKVSVPNFPGAQTIVNTLDYVPVPPVNLARPPAEQLPVQLPPPPQAWAPMVTSNPAPAAPKTAGMSTGAKAGLGLVIGAAAVVATLVMSNALINKATPIVPDNNHVATSGVTITGFTLGSWSSCDNPTKGYLPGASGCKGTVTLAMSKTVSTGYLLVNAVYPGGGASFHGAVNVVPGQKKTTVPVAVDYIRSCVNAPTFQVSVYDRTIDDPSKSLMAFGNWTFKTINCTGFPAGGLGG